MTEGLSTRARVQVSVLNARLGWVGENRVIITFATRGVESGAVPMSLVAEALDPASPVRRWDGWTAELISP
jgi:hypothetical protein